MQAAAFPTAPTHQTEAAPLIAALKQSNLQSWATSLANYYNRYYTSTTYGVPAATWLFNTVVAQAASNPLITVEQVTHSGFPQKSVVAKIPGSSGTGIVIVSAHFDSIGSTTSGRAPGADDNASGVVVVLEALRVLAAAKYKPKNSLEFHFYAAEEGGLLGSRAIMNSYAAAGKNVLAVVNQDMTGYSPNNVIAVYTDFVDAALTAFVKKLVPVYTQLPLVTDVCGYACSDHGSARAAGYPAAYVCDDNMQDSSPYLHSASDTLSTLSYPHILQHAKVSAMGVAEGRGGLLTVRSSRLGSWWRERTSRERISGEIWWDVHRRMERGEGWRGMLYELQRYQHKSRFSITCNRFVVNAWKCESTSAK